MYSYFEKKLCCKILYVFTILHLSNLIQFMRLHTYKSVRKKIKCFLQHCNSYFKAMLILALYMLTFVC